MTHDKKLVAFLTWIIALGLLVWVARSVPLAATWGALRRLDGWAILALVGMNILVLLALNGRWWLILNGFGYQLPFFNLLGHRLASFGVSYFTPGPQFGGEPVQVLLIERLHNVPRETAVASVALDKTLELLINFTFLLGGVTAVLQGQLLLNNQVGNEAVLFALGLLALPMLYLFAIWQGKSPISGLFTFLYPQIGSEKSVKPVDKIVPKLFHAIQEGETKASQFCQESPAAFWWAFAISVVGWGLIIAEFWLMLTFLGIVLTPLQVVGMLTAARIAFLLPLPGGLGTLEASQVLALAAMEKETAVGISVTLLIRLRDVLLGLFGLWWAAKKLKQ